MLTPIAPSNKSGNGNSLFHNKPNLVVYVRSAARSSFGTGDKWEDGKLGIIKELKYYTEDEQAVRPKETGFGEDVRYIASFYEEDKNENKWGSMLFTQYPTAIPDGAFQNCAELTEVRIPETVTSFGNNVFSGCEKLKSIILLSTTPATTVSTSTFTNSTTTENLATVYVRKSALASYQSAWSGISVEAMPYIQYTSKENVVVNPYQYTKYEANVEYMGSNIVDGVGYLEFLGVMTELPAFIFWNEENLTSITIPASITKIGSNAFDGCKNLTTVTFEEGSRLTEIGNTAFAGTALPSVELPNSVTTIEANAYMDCNSLTSIHLPSSVTSIGSPAFYYDSSKTTARVTDLKYDGTLEKWCAIDFGNENANPMRRLSGTSTVKNSQGQDVIGETLTIPSTITEIKPYAFYNVNITALDLGNVTKIGKEGFESSDMKTLTIKTELTDLGENAFRYTYITTLNYNVPNATTMLYKPNETERTYYLTTVNIGSDVQTIPAGAFEGYKKISSIEIPASVTAIGADAFKDCTSLATAKYTGTLAGWCGITFGNEKANPMSCMTTGSATVSDGTDNLITAELAIPSTVEEVKAHTFYNSCIEKLTIPATVTGIAATAFSGCTALTEVTADATTPLAITAGTFASATKANVPVGGYMDYMTADVWKTMILTPMAGAIELVDDSENPSPYGIDQTVEGCTITYQRTFKNDSWQALFVPFAMTYDDWKDKGEVAELVSVDEDGTLVWEIIEDKEEPVDQNDPNGETQTIQGKIEAGKPYIFKPNKFETGEEERTVTFSVSNAALASNGTKTDVKPVKTGDTELSGYVLSGTYAEKKDMKGIYALAGGVFRRGGESAQALSPYRIFLTVPSTVGQQNAPIRNRINGVDVTAIEGLEFDEQPISDGNAYNLQGLRVDDGYKGIVIVNGKKVLRK